MLRMFSRGSKGKHGLSNPLKESTKHIPRVYRKIYLHLIETGPKAFGMERKHFKAIV